MHGIASKYPELHEQRQHVGKFYFRPPGGESWCDVILRLRSVLDTITREYRGERVLIVGHQVIVNCFRYLLEHCDKQTILASTRPPTCPTAASPRTPSPRPGQARQAAAGPVQLRRAAGSGRYPRHGPARHAGRTQVLGLVHVRHRVRVFPAALLAA
ncbi:histidine phosphatase family protein [Janthinobacterium sp. 61]|uniref:histidine phosphatase family protein n=1 Tax=unclassified Janthinobacterium TaxID=2610881 RepID=UPI00214BF9EB|nr:histidine phosphatase family protein [Janthinobacterium sp. 61]